MMASRKHILKWRRGRPMPASMSGLTLVELMIAVVLGLGVMGGILSLYVNVGESASYLNAASRVQENGRFAINHIGRTLRMAGYDDPETATAGPTTVLEGKAGSAVSMGDFTIRGTSDAVVISHEGAALVRNCQGVQVAEDTWVTNTYAISSDDEMICNTVTTVSGVTTTTAGQVIAEGVEDMEILYGVDSDADGIANRYRTAATVTDWADVVSARIALLVNSVEPVYASTLHECESCNTFNPTANNLLRGEFHTTIRFRNVLGTST